MYQILIGTNSVRGSLGIYSLSLSDDGALKILHTKEAYNSGYLSLCGNRLYAVSEGMTFMGRASGGVSAYVIAPDGSLQLTGARPTGGQRPCCLCADETSVYVSNFYGGLLPIFPLGEDGSIGEPRLVIDEGPEPGSPPGPKALHCVGLLPDGVTLAAVSLTRMSLLLYDAQTGSRLAEYLPDPGQHPRHFAASPDGKYLYLLMQQPAEIHMLKADGLESVCTCVLDRTPLILGASAIRVSPDGRFVLAAVRDTAELHVLRAEDGQLTPCACVKLPGDVPRDFAFTPDGRFVITALQYSDTVCVHRFDDGVLTLCGEPVHIPSPASIVTREVL